MKIGGYLRLLSLADKTLVIELDCLIGYLSPATKASHSPGKLWKQRISSKENLLSIHVL